MINFVVCDDNNEFLKLIVDCIKAEMFRLNIKNRIYTFSDYNEDFIKITDAGLDNLIYIMDIETPTSNGITMARMIRDKDKRCHIIFITAYVRDYFLLLLSTVLYQCCTISKLDAIEGKDIEQQLIEAINHCLHFLNRQETLILERSSYKIFVSLCDIIMILSSEEKNCIDIVTTKNTIIIRDTLSNILSRIDSDQFVRVHRSCIINKEHISEIDEQNKIIYFDCNKETNLLAEDYKQRLGI